jgi:hypothetical protein
MQNISTWPLSRVSVLLFFANFQRLFNPMKTLVLLRNLARVFRGLTALELVTVASFLRKVRPNKVNVLVVLRAVYLAVSPTARGILSYLFMSFQMGEVVRRRNFESSGYTSFHGRISLLHLAIECARYIFLEVARLT